MRITPPHIAIKVFATNTPQQVVSDNYADTTCCYFMK